MEEKNNPDNEGRSVLGVRTMEAVVAIVLLLFSATFMYSSYKLGFRWGDDGPQSGYFPFYVSLIIFISSGIILFQALAGKLRDIGESFIEVGQLKQVLSVLIPAAVYVLGIQLIGIYVSSAVYIALFMRLLGKYSWIRSVFMGVAISVTFFFMFEVWFKVPLYKGTWDLTGWTGY